MTCAGCGRDIPDNAAFCTYCGAATGVAPPATLPPQPPPAQAVAPQAPQPAAPAPPGQQAVYPPYPPYPPPGVAGPQPYAQPGTSQSDAIVGLIVPIGRNPLAVVSRVCALISLVPCFALLFGPVAIVTGILALRAYNRDPSVRFKGSALFGIILGSITLVVNLVALVLMLLNGHSTT